MNSGKEMRPFLLLSSSSSILSTIFTVRRNLIRSAASVCWAEKIGLDDSASLLADVQPLYLGHGGHHPREVFPPRGGGSCARG